jgi:hypothetical protein
MPFSALRAHRALGAAAWEKILILPHGAALAHEN